MLTQPLKGVEPPVGDQKFLARPHPVGSARDLPPVYWANDLFLRGAIYLAADMAESGRTITPRNDRNGYPRAPLSAPCRTVDSFGQTWLASIRDPIAPASARAPLYVANPSNRSRSHPDHAAARHDSRGEGLRAASWRLDRGAAWPSAEGSALPARHRGAAARRSAPDRASRGRTRHGVDGDARQRRADSLRRRRP